MDMVKITEIKLAILKATKQYEAEEVIAAMVEIMADYNKKKRNA